MNILFVSIAFPPKRDPECLQAAKYFKYLSQIPDVNIDVVTSSVPTLNMPVDESLSVYDVGYRQKIEVPIPESKLGNFILRRLSPARVSTPDPKKRFGKASSFVQASLKSRPDVIYSRAYPLSSCLLGANLKRAFGVPWVMHLSDPWVGCAVNVLTPPMLELNSVLEREHVGLADIVTVTTEKTREMYAKRYPEFAHKFELSPNVYDPDERCESSKEFSKSGPFRIVYTGGLAGERSPVPLFRALDELKRLDGSALDSLEVQFAGDADRGNRKAFAEASHPCIRWLGQLPYGEARALQHTADLLLCIEVPCRKLEEAVFFPSKILDYMLVQCPIMAITTPQSQVDETFKQLGWASFGHNQSKECARYLLEAIERKRSGQALCLPDEPPESFSADFQAQELHRRLVDLVQSSSLTTC